MQYEIPFALHHNVLDWLQEKKKKTHSTPPLTEVETIKINIIIKRKTSKLPTVQC